MKNFLLVILSSATFSFVASAQTVNCEQLGKVFPVNNAEIIQRIEGRNLGFNVRAHLIGTIERYSQASRSYEILLEGAGRKVALFSGFQNSLDARGLAAPGGNLTGKSIELCGYVNIIEKNSDGDFSTPVPKGIYAFTTFTSFNPKPTDEKREDGFVRLDGTIYGSRP